MQRSNCLLTALLAVGLLAVAEEPGQAPASQPPPPAATPSAIQTTLGAIDVSGLVDGYYSFNFNHPASGDNQLRNFDVKANQFSLNMAKLTFEHSADPIGFRLDFGFGRAFEMVHGAETAPDVFRNIEQAYLSVKPASLGGFQADFGKFVTSAGAEVIETNANWNYSRSLLFAWAIPYYHFGVRTSVPMGKYFTGGVQVVNGWNNVEDNNTGKTVGLTGTLAVGKVNWYGNYYVGPEKASTNEGLRHLWDTTLLVNATDTAAFYINFDYGADKNIGPGRSHWVGVAGAARFQVTPSVAFAPRVEWFNDADGFSTGTRQKLKEATLTLEYKWLDGLVSRLEYRRDWSDQPFFDRGSSPAGVKHQQTLLAGLMLYFAPKK